MPTDRSNTHHSILDDKDRHAFLRVGFIAVFAACALFAPLRLITQLRTGLTTPWWANALAALAVLVLRAWYLRDPDSRCDAAVHGTAAIATTALVIPLAYGMGSTVWWLSLVVFAMALLGTRREALFWGASIFGVVVVATVAEDYLQLPGTAGETPIEQDAALVVYMLVLFVIAWGFRIVVESRSADLSRARQQAQASSEAKSRFMAHMSHELRTPLNGIIAMTDLVLREGLTPNSLTHIETANSSGKLLLRLIEDVLDAARIEDDALVLRDGPFDLHTTMTEILVPLARRCPDTIQFTASADPDVAERRQGDAVRVAQVLMNVASNALKYTKKGEIRVHLSAGPEPDQVQFEVTDTGEGIPREQLDAVFEPFVQVTEDEVRHAGTGLGLAITRELARRMNGDVHVSSQPGRGSTFTTLLRLPVLSPEPGPVDLLAVRKWERRTVPEAGPSLKILVADDDLVNRTVFRLTLKLLGHETTEVCDGIEALEELEKGQFDVLLTDIEMPRMDGLTLTRRIRETQSHPDLFIVAVTAHTDQTWRNRAADAGVDEFLSKPFDVGQVAEILVLRER